MVFYDVYRAFFLTLAGTFRTYIGYTGNAEKREDKLGLNGVDWTKCLKKGTLKLKVLVPSVDSKAVALALEALHAAKAIQSDPEHVRGGPWLSVKALKADDLYEIQATAACSSAVQLGPLAELLGPTSRLYKHLENLDFGPKTKQASSSSSTSSRTTTTVSAKAKAQPKAKTKAKTLKIKPADMAKVKAVVGPKSHKKLKLFIRAKRSGAPTGESGCQFRDRKGMEGAEFVKHKLGKKPAQAKKRHWQNYAPMRKVRKRPSAK